MFLTPCAIAGYMLYPMLSEFSFWDGQAKVAEEAPPVRANQPKLLKLITPEEVAGSWALSPRSTSLVSSSGTLGRRGSLSLESWGGGDASFSLGTQRVEGPIAWHIKSNKTNGISTLHLDSKDQKLELQFSKVNGRLVLVMDLASINPEQKDYIRFLKAS